MPGSGVAGYAELNVRVRVRYATLLTPQELAGLSAAPDLHSLIDLLKRTAYGPYLMKVEENDLTPKRIVYQIKSRLADAYATAIRLAPAHTCPLLVQFYRNFEVDNLKAVLRGIESGAAGDRVRYVLFPFGPMTVLPSEAMLTAGSVGAAVERLRGTPYYGTLSHAMKRYTAEQSLFPLEVALDLSYWRELWNAVSRLPHRDRAQSLRLVGSLVDVNNLMWAIRYRVYHHLSEEELINYTLPFGYRVRDDDIRAIAAGADIPPVLARIYPDLPNVDVLLREPRQGLPELEVQLQRHIAERCRAAFIGYPFHIGVTLAYLVLNKLEIQDLIVLIEAKSARVPVERFQSFLLMGSAIK